jgi:hypothetical protein
MNLSLLAFYVFLSVAAGGLLVAGLIVFRIKPPALLGTAHGLGAFTGLGLLLAANLQGHDTAPLAWWAFGILAAGFTGGLTLFKLIFKKSAPLPFIAAHAALGITGIYLLSRVVSI